MMRWLLLLLALGGCAHGKPVPPAAFAPAPGQCWAEGLKFLIGKHGDSVLASEAMAYSGARAVRWIRPKEAVTMDFRADRLNIRIDKRRRVKGFSCG